MPDTTPSGGGHPGCRRAWLPAWREGVALCCCCRTYKYDAISGRLEAGLRQARMSAATSIGAVSGCTPRIIATTTTVQSLVWLSISTVLVSAGLGGVGLDGLEATGLGDSGGFCRTGRDSAAGLGGS